jgi:hypothetical protein
MAARNLLKFLLIKLVSLFLLLYVFFISMALLLLNLLGNLV